LPPTSSHNSESEKGQPRRGSLTLDQERSILGGWRLLFIWATLITPFAYFSVDLIHIPERYHPIVAVCRVIVAAWCGAYLFVGYWRPTWVARHWRGAIRLLGTTYYAFLIWLESIAIDPTVSRYYLGMLLVAGGFMMFRVSLEHSIILSLATLAYVIVNYDSPIIGDAIFDLLTFGSIFFVIIRNYKRIETWLEHSLRSQGEIIATINHGWIVPFRATARLAEILKNRLDGEHREMAEVIEYQARFMHTEAKELIDLSRDEPPTGRHGQARFERVFRQAQRTIEFIKQGSTIRFERDGVEIHELPDIIINASEETLFRIFITLLSNSTNYSPDKQTLVDFEIEQSDLIVRLSNKTRRHLNNELLFRKYKSQEPGGTGIGLYNVRTLAEGLGGGITARIKPDRITFELRLPLPGAPEYAVKAETS
jgi:signal transduction histidine kinase